MKVYQNDVCGEGVGRGTRKDGVWVENGGEKDTCAPINSWQ